MPFLVKKDEPTNPADVGFFSAQSVVLKAQGLADLVKQARRSIGHGNLPVRPCSCRGILEQADVCLSIVPWWQRIRIRSVETSTPGDFADERPCSA